MSTTDAMARSGHPSKARRPTIKVRQSVIIRCVRNNYVMRANTMHIISIKRRARLVSPSIPKCRNISIPLVSIHVALQTHTSFDIYPTIPYYLCGGAGNEIWICCVSTGLPLSLLDFFPDPAAPLRPFFAEDDLGGGPDGGGGGNQHASAASRGFGQPCFCLISGEADEGVTKPG